jgi:hypothetical protein
MDWEIAWASVFRLKRQQIYVYLCKYIYCSETELTEKQVPLREWVHLWDTCKGLTHWNSETVYWSEIVEPPQGPPPPSLTGALTGHCVARRRRTCKLWNGTGEGNVRSQMAFHFVGMKPGEASHFQRRAQEEASDQSHWGNQCSEMALTGNPSS